MSSFQAEDMLAERVQFLLDDKVYVDTAMRNLIAKVFGIYTAQDPSISFSMNSDPQVVYKDIMSSARFILQAFNSHSLNSYEDWAEAFPQGEDSTADDRFKSLITYKAAIFLKSKLEGKKFSKALGRRYLNATNVWSSCVLPAAQEAANSSGVEQSIFLYFSTEFGLSLADDFVDADLVWTSDFQKTLKEKKVKRAEIENQGNVSSVDKVPVEK